jgi:hypothetical protein
MRVSWWERICALVLQEEVEDGVADQEEDQIV